MEDAEGELRTRDGLFNLCYYVALAVLLFAEVWHWIFGGQFLHIGTVALWSIVAISALGLLNCLGLFGRR